MLARPGLDARVHLADVLDGKPSHSSPSVHLLYSSMIATQLRWFTDVDYAIQALPGRAAGVVPSSCDAVGSLARMLGASVRQLHLNPVAANQTRLIVAGCSRNLPDLLPSDFFERGGVLVTSDQTILDVPFPPGLLSILSPASPRQASLLIHHDQHSVSRKVKLAAGHIPVRLIDPDNPNARVVAVDRLTGDPIVVQVRVGSGWVLHSVAHWFQDETPGISVFVEPRRGYDRVQQHRAPSGLVDAARAMVLSLLHGLRHSLVAGG